MNKKGDLSVLQWLVLAVLGLLLISLIIIGVGEAACDALQKLPDFARFVKNAC